MNCPYSDNCNDCAYKRTCINATGGAGVYDNKFPYIKAMIQTLIDMDGSGGKAHIVVSDDNLYDEDLDCVIKSATEEDAPESELCIAICTAMKKLTFRQRCMLFDSFEDYYYDKETYYRSFPHHMNEKYVDRLVAERDYQYQFHEKPSKSLCKNIVDIVRHDCTTCELQNECNVYNMYHAKFNK